MDNLTNLYNSPIIISSLQVHLVPSISIPYAQTWFGKWIVSVIGPRLREFITRIFKIHHVYKYFVLDLKNTPLQNCICNNLRIAKIWLKIN